MESLFGKSLLSAAVAFPRLQTGVAADKADAAVLHTKTKATSGVQSREKNSSSSSSSSSPSNSGTLPLPYSRSLLPGPLKFLWCPKQDESQNPQLEDAAVLHMDPSEPLLESGNSIELVDANATEEVAADESDSVDRKSWAPSVWGLRSIWPKKDASTDTEACKAENTEEKSCEGDTPQPEAPPAAEESEEEEWPVCLECEMDGTEGSLLDSSMLEVPHVQVAHNKDSFSKFLQPVSLSEAKVVVRMSHLCNLAYKVRDIQPSDLLRYHHLRLVTSSIEKKVDVDALTKEKASTTNKEEGDGGAESKQRLSITPASAYSLASAVASYLHSHTKSLLHLKKQNEELQQDTVEDTSGLSGRRSETSETGGREPEETDYESSGMASFIASSPVTAVVAAKEGTKDAVAKDLQSLTNCPCEWYCCDDRRNLTRYFVIQGSESLASWQANLLFEPTHFEDSSLGVLVHRGIYEAAKGLFEQLLPCVLEHLEEHGEHAQFCFTGHSLGGSLATLVSLMLQIRGIVRRESLQPVLTFGSPCIMCGGDYLLEKLGLPKDQIRSVILHRDIVPRTFACNYPDHVAEILKRLNGSFRDHPCLNNQKLLYAPMGQFVVLQPREEDAPSHPLLPPGLGLYVLRHPEEGNSSELSSAQKIEIRGAQRAFLNSPHPLEILSDPGSYGSEGSISRDHDPRSYMKSINKVVKEEAKKSRRLKRQQRRGLWWPLMTAELCSMFMEAERIGEEEEEEGIAVAWGKNKSRSAQKRYSGLVGAQHGQVLLLFILSVKLVIAQSFSAFFAWV